VVPLSIAPLSKSIEETKAFLDKQPDSDINDHSARYLVHTRDTTNSEDDEVAELSQLVGLVGIRKPIVYGVPLADDFTVKSEKILALEIGYQFLPTAWGKGYAPEAIKAFVESYGKTNAAVNAPYEQVYFLAMVGEANSRSVRVMEKVGFERKGIHTWDGPDTFIGGAMQPPRIVVFGMLSTS
jgi:RimJ/RimL family protein N-acetyltransferase